MSKPDPRKPDAQDVNLPDAQRVLKQIVSEAGANQPVIDEEILIEIDDSYRQRQNDDILLARFFGVCVLMIGLVTIVPAIYYWVVSTNQEVPAGQPQWQVVSRWAYILGFLGAVHVLYGIYVMQLVDFSALQTLSIFLLLVTCAYGFTSMSLWLDQGNGVVARFLQLPEVIKSRAMIWCGIMFGISALSCYLLGRESMLWRRRHASRRITGSGFEPGLDQGA